LPRSMGAFFDAQKFATFPSHVAKIHETLPVDGYYYLRLADDTAARGIVV
jgi:hypothetical protein